MATTEDPSPRQFPEGRGKPYSCHFSRADAREKWHKKNSPPLGAGLGVGENPNIQLPCTTNWGSLGFRAVRATLVVAPHKAGTKLARTYGVSLLNSQRAKIGIVPNHR